jgi:retron-type reverse transcriptase
MEKLLDLYEQICLMKNLIPAWRNARKHKTKKDYILEFEKELGTNLFRIQKELIEQNYSPKPLKTFILRDPKTRIISKSDFRDRIVHHAIIKIIEPLFDKSFIYDSCANRKGKGNLFALKRFNIFKRRVTDNLHSEAYCLKADIKHYFQEVNHTILINFLSRKIKDERVIELIKRILENGFCYKGMPLGNLTSQFFANVYLNELDYFAKHILKIKYYIRYVDDFIILHENKEQLETWKMQLNIFLREKLKIELHPQKSRVISISKGIDFVGFRNFYYYRLLRKRNIKNMTRKIKEFKRGFINIEKLAESFQGWNAYAKWADSHKLRRKLLAKVL